MKKESVRLLVRYGITAGIAALITWIVTQTYGLSDAETAVEKYRILCDAFTIPGVIFVMVGLLIRLMDCGLLDGLSYAMRSLYRVFIPGAARQDEKFYDYLQRKKEERKGRHTAFILHVGILFMIPALIFYLLFYQLY
ncbi:MAG: DUF3899 domain-containing protein [Acetatifactor sp.]